MEVFKLVNWNNNYLVTSYGRMFKKVNGIFIESNYYKTRWGYLEVYTSKEITKFVHRIVALHFLENPRKLNEINHIDGNKLNNHYDNLEWCTHQENVIHAFRNGLNKHSESSGVPKRQVICVQTKEIFESISEASRVKNVNVESISRALKLKLKAGGYNWDYIELNENDNEYIFINKLY